MSHPEIKIGARGWCHPQWVGDFYPDDMPEDWWLPYYSNEFDVVLVPWDELQQADADVLRTWVEDTKSDFEFFLELPANADVTVIDNAVAVMGAKLAGIVIKLPVSSPTEIDLNAGADGFQAWLQTLPPALPVSLPYQFIAHLSGLSQPLSCYWQAEHEAPQVECPAGLAVCETNGTVVYEPKALKNLLQHCRSLRGPSTISVFFGGNPPRIEEIRNAIMILQMLG